MHIPKDEMKKIIVGSGLATADEVVAAENESSRSSRSVIDVLTSRGLISEGVFSELLSDYFKVSLAKFESMTINPAILELIPESYAKSKGVILFEYDPKSHTGALAMLDPYDFEVLNFLRAKLNAWLTVYLMTPSNHKFALKLYKRKISDEFTKIIEENLKASASIAGAGTLNKLVEAVPVVKILDGILEHAVTLDASDIHFEPFRDKLLVRYRMDGVLQEVLSLPKEIAPILIARIKVVANLQIDIHNAPQDGRLRFPLEDHFVDIRVSVIPTFHGEKAEMRLLKGSLRSLSLTELGVEKDALDLLLDAIKKPHGLILATGPTGSGKTTTLYAILEVLNTPKVNITTIEDPIEYDIPRVNQTQVNVKAGLTFATGLRTLVRQNPDIVMIGEIRDPETADIAINAALTGHLLLSTLHTNDAPTAIPRLADLKVEPFLLASTLNLVIAQRLVRRLCNVCIVSQELNEHTKKILKEQAAVRNVTLTELPTVSYGSRGCPVCAFSGFRGQVGIFEILYVTDDIRNLILSNASTQAIRDSARVSGMRTLFEDGLRKVAVGLTSIEEVIRVASE